MAKMIPNTIHSSVRSGAERRMFRVIESADRTDNWVCLHSLGLARHGTKRVGEIDFVLVTTHGVFVLEVKGGRIRRERGLWVYTDRYGDEHCKSEGPFDQAGDAMFALERELRKHFEGTRLAQVLIGFGVVVPDVEFTALGPDYDREQIYDVTDRRRPFRSYLDVLAKFWRGRNSRLHRGLRDEDIECIAGYLRGDFDLVPKLDTVLNDTGQELIRLTEEQFVVFDALHGSDRVIIEGPAGSGKTILAVEAVRRAARRGDRVFLTCYNRLLAEKLQRSLENEFSSERVVVSSLYSFFMSIINKSSIVKEFEDRQKTMNDKEVFGDLIPEFAHYAALEDIIPPFDFLVIDEAQDVLTMSTLEVLSELLKLGLKDGRWIMFLDSNNQASVYGRLDAVALDRVRVFSRSQLLTVNCRNTREIALHTTLMARPRLTSSGRVDGPPVEFISYSGSKTPLGKLGDLIHQIRAQGISDGRITVLLTRVPDSKEEAKLEELGLVALQRDSVDGIGHTVAPTWAIVSGFKGLENDVIILVGVEDIDDDWWRAVCYVGMSRARTRLYVILAADCELVRKKRWKAHLESMFEGGS